MAMISTLHVVNHTHTDIGFTDYPETVQRQHCGIIDEALAVCERQAHRPDEARFRWTCEIAWTTAKWFDQASTADIERFRNLHADGLLAVNAMPFNWTPLVSPALAVRSLRPLARLKRDYGIDTRTAMQGDVNGLGWFWIDILSALGIDSLVMATNPHRGMPVDTMMRLFRWQTPSGNSCLTLHGWHYTAGANTFYVGDDDLDRSQAAFDKVLAEVEARGAYPLDIAMVQLTNAAAPDTGYPTESASDFVERWNGEGRTPRLVLSTLDQAMGAIAERAADTTVETAIGDWTDFWSDGVGSTAFETAVARAGERLLPAVETIHAFLDGGDDQLLDHAAEQLALYDEHTWGAFSSVAQPDSPFSRSQLACKCGFAHRGFAVTHEILATSAKDLARRITGGQVEGDIRFRRGTDPPIPIEDQSYFVLNPSGQPLSVRWGVPWDYGGAAPQRVLQSLLRSEYMPGMDVERTGLARSGIHVIKSDLPAYGFAVVRPEPARQAPSEKTGPDWIENDHFRIEVCPETGALKAAIWKRTGRNLSDARAPMAQMLYETLADPSLGRNAIFGGHDFDGWRLDTFNWPRRKPDFQRSTAAKVRVREGRWTPLGLEIDVGLDWPGRQSATVTYRLPTDDDSIHVDTLIHKAPIEEPESLYVCFGLPGTHPEFHLDVGDHTINPLQEQLPHTSQGWTAVQTFAALATSEGALTVATLDTPLVQIGGIQTENPLQREIKAPRLAFWVLNNHWDMNFAASQSGRIPARFRIKPSAQFDPIESERFAIQALTAPVIVRTYDAEPREAQPAVRVDTASDIASRLSTIDGQPVLALRNQTGQEARLTVSFADREPVAVTEISALGDELTQRKLAGDGSLPTITLAPHQASLFRIDFQKACEAP